MNALGMKIVAEGVETEEQAKRLIELGCDYLQGYFYSRPIDAEKFLSLMKKEQYRKKLKICCNIKLEDIVIGIVASWH